MNNLILLIILILFVILVSILIWLYKLINTNTFLIMELANIVGKILGEKYREKLTDSLEFDNAEELIKQTFDNNNICKNIKTVVVNNSIELIWTGDVDGDKSEYSRGFIIISLNGLDVNSPISDIEDARFIGKQVSYFINDFFKKKDD